MAKATASKKAAEEAKPSVPAVRKGTSVGQKLDFAADAGAGFEGAGASAFAVPFLIVLQSGSPQCKRSEAEYIKGAEEGMLYNTVTGEIFNGDKGVEIIPCAFTNTFVEWGLREKQGGFIAEYDSTTGASLRARATRDDKSRDVLPSGNQISDHRNHYVLYKDENGEWQPALMSLTSTSIKASRGWMSNMQRECKAQSAPMFGLRYLYTTAAQKNDKGTWYGPVFTSLGLVEEAETYAAAKSFHEQVKTGGVKPPAREAATSGDGSVDRPDEM